MRVCRGFNGNLSRRNPKNVVGTYLPRPLHSSFIPTTFSGVPRLGFQLYSLQLREGSLGCKERRWESVRDTNWEFS